MGISFSGLEARHELDREACLTRLEQAKWARLLLSVRSLPSARPVPLALWGEDLLIATDESVVWRAAQHREVLTVNVDGQSSPGVTWTVTVTGEGALIDDTRVEGTGTGLDLGSDHPLLPYLGHGARLLRIELTIVSGDETWWHDRHVSA